MQCELSQGNADWWSGWLGVLFCWIAYQARNMCMMAGSTSAVAKPPFSTILNWNAFSFQSCEWYHIKCNSHWYISCLSKINCPGNYLVKMHNSIKNETKDVEAGGTKWMANNTISWRKAAEVKRNIMWESSSERKCDAFLCATPHLYNLYFGT